MFAEDRTHQHFPTYKALHQWSIDQPNLFWRTLADFTGLSASEWGTATTNNHNAMPGAEWFPQARLNFAENILSQNDSTDAIVFWGENKVRKKISWAKLNKDVSNLAATLQAFGIKPGDRVAALMANVPETIVWFLATASLGAIWSSCSPDFGANGVIERFSQIKPKLLIISDRYYYNGKEINILERLPIILKKIKSIKNVIILNYPGRSNLKFKLFKKVKTYSWKEIKKIKSKKIRYHKFDFDHELAILYSSGTTGKPKCICHRAGGVLLQHLKEHQLHCEINPGDNIFYFTTCGWMMWNWLISSLASKASIVLFDGFPMYKKNDLLFKIANNENISLFGISAKYIESLRKLNLSLISKYRLKKLRTVCSTGSPLSEDGFKYIYKKIKKNVHLASISGGTDIVSCFVLGNIYSPVISGQIQNNGLGMDVGVFNEKGRLIKNKKGELICKSPFPSMPKKFWNDKNNSKYKKAYFKRFKGVWHHGDYAERKSSDGYIIYGRSDATLNPGGVRLGTSEIYSVVEKFKEIKESIVIGQTWDNDIRIILFVVINNKYQLDKSLIEKIKKKIRFEASPRHVPSRIIKVSDIPRTKNGKIVELAVKNIIEGNKIKNIQALANPEILNEFKNLTELKT